MTFRELALWRSSIIEQEKLEWRRMASLLSLTYNVNRGKGKQMTVSDFFPFEEEVSDEELSSNNDVMDLVARVEQLKDNLAKAQDNGEQTE